MVEILTANGASYSSNKKNSPGAREAGRAMLKAALVIQIGVIVLFVTLAAYFQRTCKRNGVLPGNLKKVLVTLYCSSSLIMIRTIYRTVEYFQIEDIVWNDLDPNTLSPLIRYEWFFWLFEGCTMMINTWLINARHPAMFLPRKNNVYLSQNGTTEIEGPGYKDDRNIVQTILDPFDLIGLIRGKDKQTKFWEQSPQGAGVAKTEGEEGAGKV